MLTKVQTMKDFKLHGIDGEVGKVKDFYFDDHYWTIRYLVADTGDWLADRLVLISPYALSRVNREERNIKINLTKKQILESPSSDTDKPVSRHFEEAYHSYYGWPNYWNGAYVWGHSPSILGDHEKSAEPKPNAKPWDFHLRSILQVSGYDIQASDGEIGHVDDFVIDDATWTIRYLIVDTKNWLPGKKVLISPKWIERVSWKESKVIFDINRESIKRAPEYSEKILLNRDFEEGLYKHYRRIGYWVA
ncbi:MAG: PRC-barrel domain-containing protein [Treponemataceae bacterium]